MSDLIRREDAIAWIHARERKRDGYYLNDYEYGWNEALDEIQSDIEDLPSAFHWTSCSKAQPKESGEYQVTLQFKWAKEIDIGEWLDGRWIGLYADDIVAWMDLPEVWEEGTDES